MKRQSTKKQVVGVASVAAVFALAPTAQADAVVFNDSAQLNLAGGDVLAAVSLWDPNRTNEGHSTVGTIQGVDFDDIDFTTQDTGADIALNSGEAGATLAISSIAQSVGREFPLVGTFLPASADNTQAELWPSGALFQSNGTTTFTFGFGAGRANTDVEVQMVGGGIWNRTDKWGVLTVSVDDVAKDILNDRGTPDLITFSATTDPFGDLAIDVVQTPGGNGTDRQWNVLGGMTVVTAVPAASISITSITSVGGGNWELTLAGKPDTAYEFRSSTTLDFTPGALVEDLAEGAVPVGTIGGTNDSVLTTDSNGDGTVQIALSGSPADFVRAQRPPPPPPLLEEYFEGGLGGFTVVDHSAGGIGTDWVQGDPMSGSAGTSNPGGFVDSGNGGSTNCVGTGIGNPGFHNADTDTCLRSPIIDLTGVAGATLSFAENLDIEGADTAVVNIIDDTNDNPGTNIIAAAIYTATDDDISNATWASVAP